ncbi:MAG: dihydrofolate reductase family protein, partial [Spirochaetaceae bacterium]|nr:dihydrofolate reductase family protein [Spirochaetaceae bacterium]
KGAKSKRKFLESKNVTLVQVAEKGRHLDLNAVIQKLGSMNYDSVLIESSGKLAESFFEAGLVQKTQVYIAPSFITKGGSGIPVGSVSKINECAGDISVSYSAPEKGAQCSQA